MELDGLFDLLHDPVGDVTTGDSWNTDFGGTPADDGALGSMGTPWDDAGTNYLEDWDRDGVANHADDWFGPGAESPFGASEGAEPLDPDPGLGADEAPPLDPSVDPLGTYTGGTPDLDASHWHHQEGQNSCAIAGQCGILESITGQPVDESQMAQLAEDNGWYHPDRGTYPSDMGKVLEAHGVPCDSGHHRDLMDVVEALDRGEKVMVGLDANEIWTPQYDANGVPVDQPDAGHAVWVTGYQISDDGSFQFITNDTGIAGGAARPVELDNFINAWDDYDNFATITQMHPEVHHA